MLVWGRSGYACAVALAIAVGGTTVSQGADFYELGTGLPENVSVWGVSPDGTVAVGHLGDDAFRWSRVYEFELITDGAAWGASELGVVVVGVHSGGGFRWSADTGAVTLPGLSDGAYSSARAVSADGVFVAGDSIVGGVSQACRWSGAGDVIGLGSLGSAGAKSWAYGISHDGGVVVGTTDTTRGREAFYWTAADGLVGLGELPGGEHFSGAYAVSADGTTVAGMVDTGSLEMFRWTAAEGMVPMGWVAWPWGVSGDGSRIVGVAIARGGRDSDGGRAEPLWMTVERLARDPFCSLDQLEVLTTRDSSPAFVWDQEHGIRFLKDVLETDYGLDLTGWQLVHAADISDDGSVIVGVGYNPDGQVAMWRAVLGDEPDPTVYRISGSVLDESGNGVPGVVLTGLPGSPSTHSNGEYTTWVGAGYTGTAVPVKEDYRFTPQQRSYDDIQEDVVAQDYVAAFGGAVQIFIGPDGACGDGACWCLDGGPWRASGQIERHVAPGVHTVSFMEVALWECPGDLTIQVRTGRTAAVTQEYWRHYCMLTLRTGPAGGGRVVAHAPADADGRCPRGAVVTLEAIPDAGMTVRGWQGAYLIPASGERTNTVTMNADKTVQVDFREVRPPPEYFTLSAQVVAGEGSLFPGAGSYEDGTAVALRADPAKGYRVRAWSGTDDDASTAAENTVTMDRNRDVSVAFEASPDGSGDHASNGSDLTRPDDGADAEREAGPAALGSCGFGVLPALAGILAALGIMRFVRR